MTGFKLNIAGVFPSLLRSSSQPTVNFEILVTGAVTGAALVTKTVTGAALVKLTEPSQPLFAYILVVRGDAGFSSDGLNFQVLA